MSLCRCMLSLVVRCRPLIWICGKSLVVNRRLIRRSGSLAKPLHHGHSFCRRRSNRQVRDQLSTCPNRQKVRNSFSASWKEISSSKKKKVNKGRAAGGFTWYEVEVPGKLSGQAVVRERRKSDASGLHSNSNRRGHFIDFRVTFHVAQLADFSGCLTAENGFFFSGGVWLTRKAQVPKVVVLEVPSKLPPPELGKIKAPQPAHCLGQA